MRYVCKNPPEGERNPYQLIDYLQYEKRLNNMDHMRISSTEPSSGILSQTK